jgi:hypothetical protein
MKDTYRKIEKLDEMVDLSPGIFGQYQHLKSKELRALVELTPTTMATFKTTPIDNINVDKYLDSKKMLLDNINVYEYLDSYEMLQDENAEFFNCLEPQAKPDWLLLDKVCSTESEVDCVLESGKDILGSDNAIGDPWIQANAAPTLQGCKAMTIDTVFQGPSAFMSVVGQVNFPIIFDTGASLAISGNWDNFVGEITSPKSDLCLGGMATDIIITGIRIVHWTFVADDGSNLIICTQCYYVPEVKARLISPQHLFKKAAGINGAFTAASPTPPSTASSVHSRPTSTSPKRPSRYLPPSPLMLLKYMSSPTSSTTPVPTPLSPTPIGSTNNATKIALPPMSVLHVSQHPRLSPFPPQSAFSLLVAPAATPVAAATISVKI